MPAADALDRGLEQLVEAGYHLAVVMLRDRSEAEDAVQDAAITAWRKAGQVRDSAHLRSWFLTIVANTCRSRQRRAWWRVLRWPEIPALEFAPAAVEEGIDLASAISRLPATDRLVLYLRFYEDLPLAAAARIAGISMPAFRSRLQRALERLRNQLGAEAP